MPTLKQTPTADLIPYAANAKLHSEGQVAAIAGSIREFGFNVVAKKDRDSVDIGIRVESLRREFDMPINRIGRTLGRADDIEKAIRSA